MLQYSQRKVDPILYFQYYWRAAVVGEKIAGQAMHTFNPRVIVRELLDELKFNNSRNPENIKFFRLKLEHFKDNDNAIRGLLKILFQRIVGEFSNVQTRPEYMVSLCESVMQHFSSGEYLDNCIQEIEKLLAQEDSENLRASIRLIVDNMVVEYRELGYSDFDIKDFARRAFDRVDIKQLKQWDFISHLPASWQDGNSDEELHAKFDLFQDQLTSSERMKLFHRLSRKSFLMTKYFFRIDGLNCKEKITIGDVIIYNSAYSSFWTSADESHEFDETFGRPPSDDCVNALVSVNAITLAGGLASAIARVEFAITCLTSVFQGQAPVRIGLSYFAFSEESSEYSKNRYEDEHENPRNRFSVDKKNLDGGMDGISRIVTTLNVANLYGWDNLLIESLTWARRAQASKDPVYKLLSFWISIETMFKKPNGSQEHWFSDKKNEKEYLINVVREVLAKHYALVEVYNFGWRLHDHLSTQISFGRYKVPSDLRLAAGLTPEQNQGVLLKDFVSQALALAEVVPNPVLSDELVQLHKFFNDSASAKSILRQKFSHASDEILMVYRMRNKIAHDGNSGHISLPILAKSAQGFAVSLISFLVGSQDDGRHQCELSRILIGRAQQFDLTLELLNSETPVGVFL